MTEPTKPAPAKPHCIARDCKSPKVDHAKGVFFCSVHSLNVPRHIRKALELEVVWLRHKGVELDQTAIGLLNVAMSREYQMRLTKDPLEMARWQEEKAAELEKAKAAETERRAREAGLALPKDVGMVVPAGGGT